MLSPQHSNKNSVHHVDFVEIIKSPPQKLEFFQIENTQDGQIKKTYTKERRKSSHPQANTSLQDKLHDEIKTRLPEEPKDSKKLLKEGPSITPLSRRSNEGDELSRVSSLSKLPKINNKPELGKIIHGSSHNLMKKKDQQTGRESPNLSLPITGKAVK